MAKKTTTTAFDRNPKVKRSGVHAKTKHSNSKSSVNYQKKYRGQGK